MPDVRLIDANALRKNLSSRYMNELYPDWRTLHELTKMRIEMLEKESRFALDHAPIIDAVPIVHGRWSEPFIGGYDGLHAVYYMTCSNCMAEARHDIFRFCPNCGARMDGGAD